MIFQGNVPPPPYGITVTITISSKGEGGTVEQIKYFAFGCKYMSLLLYFESGTPAQQLTSTFPPF